MGHRLLTRQSSCLEASAIHILHIPVWVSVCRQDEHFHQSIVDAAIAEWRRCLSACVRVSGAHFEHHFQQVYKLSYFVIYLPKVIKLMES